MNHATALLSAGSRIVILERNLRKEEEGKGKRGVGIEGRDRRKEWGGGG